MSEKKKIKIIVLIVALILVCTVIAAVLVGFFSYQNSDRKIFDKQREIAESKSGMFYRTTFFQDRAEVNKAEGVPYSKEIDGKYCYVYMNEDGDEVQLTPATLTDVRGCYEVAEGTFLSPATLGEKWGYVIVDTTNPSTETLNWNTERIYDNAEAYFEGWAAAEQDGKYGVINLNGEFIIEPEYDGIKYCSFGVMPALQNGEWYFINLSNEKIFGPFEEAESYAYGYAAVKKDGKWGFINKSGTDATTFVYDEAYSVQSNADTGALTAWVRIGDKWEKVEIGR